MQHLDSLDFASKIKELMKISSLQIGLFTLALNEAINKFIVRSQIL